MSSSSETTNKTKTKTQSYQSHLDDDDDDNDHQHARRLLLVRHSHTPAAGSSGSNNDDNELFLYGGGKGIIVGISNSKEEEESNTKIIRHWDDDEDIRAIGESPNQQMVAVGLDTGSLLLYTCTCVSNDNDDNDESSSTPPPSWRQHPFWKPTDNHNNSNNNMQVKVLPSFTAPFRDVKFIDNKFLAVATEEGFSIIHIETQKQYLAEESSSYHKESGIRNLTVIIINHNNDNDNTGTTRLVATLAMNGILGLWDVTSSDPQEWTSVALDSNCPKKFVTKPDTGEILGADAWDRSCQLYFDSKSQILVVPGETYWQIIQFQFHPENQNDKKTVTTTKYHALLDTSDGNNGHIESIVTCTAWNNNNHFVTAGRDGRVILWKLSKKKDDGQPPNMTKIQTLAELGPESAPTDIMVMDDNNNNTLQVMCADGTLVTIPNVTVPATSTSATTVSSAATAAVEEENETDKSKQQHVHDLDDDDDDDDDKETDQQMTSKKKGSSPPNPVAVSEKKKKDRVKQDDSDDDDDDEDLFAGEGNNNNKTSGSATKKNRFVDDEADEDDDDDDDDMPMGGGGGGSAAANGPTVLSPSAGRVDLTTTNASDDEDDDDDNNYFDDNNDSEQRPSDFYHGTASTAATMNHLPDPQPAFAPSSTPLDLTRRFLCWNHIGSVTHRHDDSGRNFVDITFTDSGFRRPIGFTDNMGFILGSLGEDGGIFATDIADEEEDDPDADDGDDDGIFDGAVPGLSEKTKAAVKRSQRRNGDPNKPTGSSIYFHRYETFASIRDKDWYLTLPSGERALGCATGEGWAAVMTSRRFLRLFSSGGNQSQVIWLEGEPVSIAGRGRFVAVFYHESEPLRDGTQKIGYKVLDALANHVIAKGPASCMSSGSTLTWVGFSNDGSLLAMDSGGMFSMLVCADTAANHSKWEWTPVLDTVGLRKASDDSYWPVTVFDGKLVCVPLKGSTKHPDATRRPVTSALGLRLPLARGNLTKCNALEELSIRAGIALGQKKVMQEITAEGEDDEEFEREYTALSAQVDKVTLKMFAATVEAGKLERALDLVERLHLEKSFELAMTIADNHRKLVDLIEDSKDRKFGGGSEDENEDDDDDDDVVEESPDFTNEKFARPRISPETDSTRKRTFSDQGDNRNVRQKQNYAY